MRETILVVEDGDAVRSLVCRMLVQYGYRALEARDGREALEICENHSSIHLVLTDVVMPNMSGGELASRLARLRPDLRVVLMSGYTAEPGLDSTAFLEKPFTSITLAEKIRQVLDAPWNGTQLRRKAGG